MNTMKKDEAPAKFPYSIPSDNEIKVNLEVARLVGDHEHRRRKRET
jgi:hypothetical protein